MRPKFLIRGAQLIPALRALAPPLDRFSDEYDTYRETVLEADAPVFVVAEAHGGGSLGKPAAGSANTIFMITHQSEEKHTKMLGSSARFGLWFAIVFFAVAAFLMFGAYQSR